MAKSFSVAEARQHFPRLIRTAERGRAVEITRRGRPVAVLLSASEYLSLTSQRPSFADAVVSLRSRLAVANLGIGSEEFEGLREKSSGRRIRL
jgi:antitoxin Phd